MALWFAGFLGTIFGLVALALLKVIINRTQGMINRSLGFLFLASGTYIAYMTIVTFLGFRGINMNNLLWWSVPLLYFVAGGIWCYFAYYMLKLRKKIEHEV